jgi:hypothetical protein
MAVLQCCAMDFGQRISIHRGTLRAGGWWWYVGLALVLSGVLPIVQGHPASKAAHLEALLNGAKILGGLLCLAGPALRWRQRVEVFERGFVWSRVYGTMAVPREDVHRAEWVHRRGRSVSINEIEIALAHGRTCSITGVENPEQLVDLLNSWSAKREPPIPVDWTAPAKGSPGGWANAPKPPRD